MNLDRNPTKKQLAELFAKCHDEENHHILWVREDGEVFVTPVPNEGISAALEGELKVARFRYETFAAGNDYVGPKAAADEGYMDEMFGYITRDWQQGLTGYIDDFAVR
jgi:hypothetical protein